MKISGTTQLPALLERCRAVLLSQADENKVTINKSETIKDKSCKPSHMIQRFHEAELNQEFDLIVIGGGINGAGIARDASERGLKVLLLEKEDFGAGCTSASTRLIHGGLRYLEHFEFRLVRESLRERELLLKNANHLVQKLELAIPVYKNDKRGLFLVKLGMILYDLLSYDKSLPAHKIMYKDDFIDYEPSIKQDSLTGGAIYYDAQVTYPERLCLENVLMAKENNALILNHAEVTGINVQSNKISSVEFVDLLAETVHKVSGKMIINASGPWVDSLCGLTEKNIPRKIGGTKGSHIIVKKFKGGPEHALYVSAKSDGRPFFIIPWQSYYLIGTTDLPFSENLNSIKASNDEINYLINETNNILREQKITTEDILYTYSGVRPLPHTKKSDPGSITRKHFAIDHKSEGINNFVSVGGKLTTYRSLSEEVVDLIYKKLNYKFVSSLTKVKPLLRNVDSNIDAYKNEQVKLSKLAYNVSPEVVKHLIDLYGIEYSKVLEQTKNDNSLTEVLNKASLDIKAQVKFATESELAFTISDVLLRRLVLGLCENFGQDAIPYVADCLHKQYGYSKEQIQAQVKQYEDGIVKLRSV